MAQTSDFQQLMTEVAAGSEEAIWELADTYTPYIIRAVRATLPVKVRTKLDSQDIAQTLWASILLNGTDLTRLESPEQLIAFLARAAQNRVIDATRHYMHTRKHDISRDRELPFPDSKNDRHQTDPQYGELSSREATPSQYACARERWSRILASASERDQTILRMRLEGHTFDVISARLEINEVTARRALQRIIEQISA